LGEMVIEEHKALKNVEATILVTVKRRWWRHHLGLWLVRIGARLIGFGKVEVEYKVDKDGDFC